MARIINRRDQKIAGQWLKNAMKGVGASTDQVISEIAPNLSNFTKGANAVGNDVLKNLRNARNSNSRIADQLANNKYMKNANLAFKNAMADLKSGNINNKAREIEALMGEDGDSEINFGDIDGDQSGESINVNVDQSGIQNSMKLLVEQSAKNTIGQVKMQKATMDTMISVGASTMQQMATLGGDMINQLNNVNSNLSALVEFQNKNMTKFIEASMAYYEYAGGKRNPNQGNIGGSNKITGGDLFNSSGTMNFGEYKRYVQQQIKSVKDNSTAGMLSSMMDEDMLRMAASNPLGFLTTGLTRYMMPKILTTSIESMEKSFTNFMPTLLSKLGEMADDESTGLMGHFKRYIGEVFGVKQQKKGKFSNINVNRGPIPFDGETKHAITELITKDLREQTGYLKIIASHYDKNAESTVARNATHWSYKQGRYVKRHEIDRDITEELTDAIRNAFTDTQFGSIMLNAGNEIVKGSSDNKRVQRDRKEFDNTVNELFALIERSDKTVDLDQLLTLVQRTGASSNTKRLLKRYIKNKYITDASSMKSVNMGRIRANKAVNDAKTNIQNEAGYYNLLNSSYYGQDIDDMLDQQHGWGKYNQNRVATRSRRYGKASAPQKEQQRLSGRLGILQDRFEDKFGSLTPDDIINRGKDFVKRKVGFKIDKFKAAASGDTMGLLQASMAEFADRMTRIASTAKHFLLGDKDDQGKFRHGILSDVANRLKETITSMGNGIKTGVMKKVFGKVKNPETGQWEKSDEPSIMGGVKNIITETGGIFKRFVFGDIENGQKGLLKGVRDAWRANFKGGNGDAKELEVSGTRVLGGTLTGGVLGAIVGGPVVGALAGLAISVKSHGDTFKEMLFGKDEALDLGDGRKVKKQGLFGRIGNTITANIIAPMKTELKYIKDSTLNVLEHKVLAPFAFAAEFVTEKVAKIGTRISDGFKNGFNAIFSSIKKEILSPITAGIGKIMTTATDLVFKRVKTMVSLPGNIIMGTIKALKIKERIDNLLPVRALKFFIREVKHLIFSGIKTLFKSTFKLIKGVITAPFKALGLVGRGLKFLKNKALSTRAGQAVKRVAGRVKDRITGSAWAQRIKEEAQNGNFGSLLDRIRLNNMDYKERNKEIKKQREENKIHDKNAKIIERASKGQFKSDTEEARTWLKYNNPKKYKELVGESITRREQGLSTRGMSPDDINRASLRDLSPEGQQVKLLQSIQNSLNKFFNRKDGNGEENYSDYEPSNREIESEGGSTSRYSGPNNSSETKSRLSAKYKTVRTMNGDYKISKASGKIFFNGRSVSYDEAPLRVRVVADHYMGTSARQSLSNIGSRIRSRFGFGSSDDTDAIVSEAEEATGETVHRHSIGGFLKSGLSLIGEKGAELVHKAKDGAVSVLSNAKTRRAAKNAKASGTSLVSNFRSSVGRKSGNKQNDELTSEREESMNRAMSYAVTAEQKQQQMKEAREEEARQEELETQKRTSRFTESIKDKLDSVFNVKNLVIAGAILLGKQLGKGLKWFGETAVPFIRDTVWPVIKGIGSAISGVLGFGQDLLGFFGIGEGHTGKGESSAASSGKDQATKTGLVKSAATTYKIAKSGGGIKYFGEKAIQKQAKIDAKALKKLKVPKTKAGKVINKLKNATGTIDEGIRKAAIKLYDNKNILDAVKNGTFIGADGGYDYYQLANGETISINQTNKKYNKVLEKMTKPDKKPAGVLGKIKSGISNVKTKVTNVIKGAKDKIVGGVKGAFTKIASSKPAQAAKELIGSASGKLSNAAKKFVEKIASLIEKFVGLLKSAVEKTLGRKLGNKTATKSFKTTITKLFQKLPSNKVTELVNKFATKSTVRTSAEAATTAASLGLSKIVEAAVFTLDGVEGAAKLFHVPADKVDGTMQAIAGAFGALNTSLVASLVIIAAETIASYSDFDLLKEIAMWLYGVIQGDTSDAMKTLEEAQEEMDANYAEYEDSILKEEYEKRKQSGQIPASMNFDDFKKKVTEENAKGSSGDANYQVKFSSKDEYNDIANRTTLDKVTGFLGGALDTFKLGWYGVTGNEKKFNQTVDNYNYKQKNIERIDKTSGKGGSSFGWGKGGLTSINNHLATISETLQSFFGKGKYGKGSSSDTADSINGKPYFSQNDSRWGSKRYAGSDDMGEAGCGPTSLAMVVNDIKRKTAVDPLDMGNLAYMTGNVDPKRGTNANFIGDSASMLGIDSDRYINPNSATLRSQIESGNPTILLGRGDGPYTSAGHYVVATGMKDGRHVNISDPRGKSYSRDFDIDELANNTESSWSLYGSGYGKGLTANEVYNLGQNARKGQSLTPNQLTTTRNAAKASAKIKKQDETDKARAKKLKVSMDVYKVIKSQVQKVIKADKKNKIKRPSGYYATLYERYAAEYAANTADTKAAEKNAKAAAKKANDKAKKANKSNGLIDAQAVIAEALKHKGEQYKNNATPYGKLMNKVFGHPSAAFWCATFVTYCFYIASGKNKELTKKVLHNATTAGCAMNVSAFKKANKWKGPGYRPKPGDVIFYTFSHTGIVEKSDDKYVYTVEGNTSVNNGNSRDGLGVWTKKKRLSEPTIKGYGITETGAGGVAGDSSSESSENGSAESGNTDNRSFLERITSYFSDFSSELGNRLIGGDYKNTDYSTILNNAMSKGSTVSESGDASSSSSSYSGTGAIGKNMSENAKFITKALRAKGVPDINIAAALGNFQTEGSIDPTVIEGIYTERYTVDGPRHKKAMKDLSAHTTENIFPAYRKSGVSHNPSAYKAKDGKYYPGLGIVQWTGPGAYNLIKNAPGGKWWSGEYQADLIVNKKPPTGSSYFGGPLGNWTKAESDISSAALNFSRYYEGNTKNGQSARVKHAKEWYSKLKNGFGKGGYGQQNVYYGGGDMSSFGSIPSTSTTFRSQPSTIRVNSTNVSIPASHGKGDKLSDKLLETVIDILTDIADNTKTSSKKLDYLKNINTSSGNNTIVVPKSGNRNQTFGSNVTKGTTSDDISARQIARASI